MLARLFRYLDRFAWRLSSFQFLSDAHRKLGAERDSLVVQRNTLVTERDELAAHAQRLSGEVRDHLEREKAWQQERARLLRQRDVLEEGRDGLAAQASRLAGDLSEAHAREKALHGEVEVLRDQRDVLETERDELKRHLVSLRGEQERVGKLLWAPPGHFYSPIVDPDDPQVTRVCLEAARRALTPLPHLRFDEEAMLRWFHRISRHYPKLPFPERKSSGYRYYFENPAFSYGDAITLFGLLLELRPKRVIEAGSGFSSCLMMDTNDRFLGRGVELTFIDPYPETLLGLLEDGDPYRERILAKPLQEAPVRLFATLEEDDILFLDSSHVLKTGSDVNHYLFHLLPALEPGVVIHIHDVLYPFEYPASWLRRENRSWNEAYALRAFLEYNDAFEIIYFNDYIYRKHGEPARSLMPKCRRNAGGSIWLRKLR